MSTRALRLFIITPLATAMWCGEKRATSRSAPPLENACGDSAVISSEPVAPREGTLFRVRVDGVPAGALLSGDVAGEALHFAPVAGSRAAESFAAAPIDVNDSLNVEVRCTA